MACRCGATVSVPTIRGLKQLESVIDQAAAPPAPVWSAWQGPIFGSGAIALFVGLLILLGVQLFPAFNEKVEWHNMGLDEAEMKRANQPVGELSLPDLYEEFVTLRNKGRSTQFDEVRQALEVKQALQGNRQLAGGILAGIGGALVILGLALPMLSAKR